MLFFEKFLQRFFDLYIYLLRSNLANKFCLIYAFQLAPVIGIKDPTRGRRGGGNAPGRHFSRGGTFGEKKE